ncbi:MULTISPECIES: carbohydrate ABC transporter permease [Actinokineospora]|uniref:ABC transporter permease n=1 Tax=Actinokineospora fastidiosa TaxID=1816 RepID=A0A918LJ55_9PSEU|nr:MULTISPECIES: sugar ABC transporter permease [Actinokineospora]UVS81549.1 L-arabinose transport system permease protein AraP [Actinokineospora sp. UTMC 2448]GGS57278.1 ABC transporter permease [Actinokineospora fastidiosa]
MSRTALREPSSVDRRRLAEPSDRRAVWRSRLYRWDVKGSPYAYVAPFFLLFGVFGVLPLAYTALISTTAWNTRRPGSEDVSVGLDNYSALLGDDNFWNALVNTLGIGVFATVPQLLFALGIAHLLNYKLRGRLALRMGVLVPYVTSVAAVALIFNQIFARDFGLLNWLLSPFTDAPIDWRASTAASWFAVSAMVTWHWTGYNALIYLAAMQTIPYELYESAAIDGAGKWRQFWSITIPSLRPTIIFTVIVSTVGALQLFAEPFLFDTTRNHNGGSERQFQTVVLYLYQQFWTNGRYGYGAAIAWTLFVITVVIVLINFLVVRRIRSSE